MKEKFVEDVKNQLLGILSSKQIEKLEDVLYLSLKRYDVKHIGLPNENKLPEQYLTMFLAAKRIEGCSDKTLNYYYSTLNQMRKSIKKDVLLIQTEDLRGHLAEYQAVNKVSKVTLDNVRRILSSFYSWLEDEDYILKSPVRRIHRVKENQVVKEILSDEAVEVLRDNCEEIRDLAMIDLLNSSGMRVGELEKLNRLDIDFNNRECVVKGKGNKERKVYFDAKTKIHLLTYLKNRTDSNEALFVSLRKPNERLEIGGIQCSLRKIGNIAGIKKVYPHKFRRTMATVAIDKGMPIEQVQQLLGHVKIDTTMHYAMVNQQNVKISHRKYIG